MKEQIALVTGGTGGLGRAVVLRLLQRGDRVIVPWYAQREVDLLTDHVREHAPNALKRIELMAADLTDPEDLEGLGHHVEELGRLDVLCNLAGGFAMNDVEDTDVKEWDRMIAMNATTVFFTTKTLLPWLRKSHEGAVVNIAAVPAVTGGGAGMVAYTASKAAVVAMTRAMAREFVVDDITVNAIAPKVIDTPANRASMPDADYTDWVTPEAIADEIAHLTGPAGRRVSGNVIVMGR
jgi:NAD(P)-dependent dehydrogenase (short-subunit alcohol dehydrogenase family)